MLDVLTLIALAFTDALNPFSIAGMVYLLSAGRPLGRGLVFIVGTLTIYFPGGIVLMEGWSAILKNIVPSLPAWFPVLMHFICGLMCLAVAFYFYCQSKKKSSQTTVKPSSLSLPVIFVFALGGTISDLPTALPYFAGVNIIASLSDTWLFKLALLSLYNFIYVSPLILVLLICVSAGVRAQAYLAKVRDVVDWCFAHVLPAAIMVLGLYLLAKSLWMVGYISLPL